MIKRVSKAMLLIMLTEMCLGGGGHLTAVGGLSLRMVLFSVAMVLTILMLLNGELVQGRYWRMVGFFSVVIFAGIVVGIWNHHPLNFVGEDVKPLLYFFMLPFFALTLSEPEQQKTATIIKISSVALAAVFLLLVVVLNLGIIPFPDFYKVTRATNEFFYRGELSFFYKGFLFLGLGSIFFFFSQSSNRFFFISILVLAIIISVTRGLLVSLLITLAVYSLKNKQFYYSILALFVAVSIAIWGNQLTINFSRWVDSNARNKPFEMSNSHLFGDRNSSDAGRIGQINEVAGRISFSSVLIGHGFGKGVPSRPVHMEISYVEIFHKQGLLGLTFWGVLAGMILKGYRKATPSSQADAFFFGALFIFIESLTNQYINNPIGMSMLLLFWLCLDKLKMEQ